MSVMHARDFSSSNVCRDRSSEPPYRPLRCGNGSSRRHLCLARAAEAQLLAMLIGLSPSPPSPHRPKVPGRLEAERAVARLQRPARPRRLRRARARRYCRRKASASPRCSIARCIVAAEVKSRYMRLLLLGREPFSFSEAKARRDHAACMCAVPQAQEGQRAAALAPRQPSMPVLCGAGLRKCFVFKRP
jgi:hypothetical protein